jgi:hypothetical protein
MPNGPIQKVSTKLKEMFTSPNILSTSEGAGANNIKTENAKAERIFKNYDIEELSEDVENKFIETYFKNKTNKEIIENIDEIYNNIEVEELELMNNFLESEDKEINVEEFNQIKCSQTLAAGKNKEGGGSDHFLEPPKENLQNNIEDIFGFRSTNLQNSQGLIDESNARVSNLSSKKKQIINKITTQDEQKNEVKKRINYLLYLLRLENKGFSFTDANSTLVINEFKNVLNKTEEKNNTNTKEEKQQAGTHSNFGELMQFLNNFIQKNNDNKKFLNESFPQNFLVDFKKLEDQFNNTSKSSSFLCGLEENNSMTGNSGKIAQKISNIKNIPNSLVIEENTVDDIIEDIQKSTSKTRSIKSTQKKKK